MVAARKLGANGLQIQQVVRTVAFVRPATIANPASVCPGPPRTVATPIHARTTCVQPRPGVATRITAAPATTTMRAAAVTTAAAALVRAPSTPRAMTAIRAPRIPATALRACAWPRPRAVPATTAMPAPAAIVAWAAVAARAVPRTAKMAMAVPSTVVKENQAFVSMFPRAPMCPAMTVTPAPAATTAQRATVAARRQTGAATTGTGARRMLATQSPGCARTLRRLDLVMTPIRAHWAILVTPKAVATVAARALAMTAIRARSIIAR